MADKFLCVLAQFDDETQIRLTRIQNELYEKGYQGKHTKNIPFHMTLGYFDLADEESLKTKILEVAHTVEPIEIVLGSIGLFGLNVLYIAPVSNERLLNLQRTFNTDVDNGLGWVPHTTMLIDDPEAVKSAIPVVVEQFKPFKGLVKSLSLYEFQPKRFITEEQLGS